MPLSSHFCSRGLEQSGDEAAIRNRTLVNWNARRFEGIEALDCAIVGRMPLPEVPGDWNIVRDCRAERCSTNSLGLSGVAFERCEIDGYGTVGRFKVFLFACVFFRTVLRGTLPHVGFEPYYLTPGTSIDLPAHSFSLRYDPDIQRRWEEAMSIYYEGVDWALDIEQARFRTFMAFPGVPGHLILRDPEHQILVKRERMRDDQLREIPRSAPLLAIEQFLRTSPFESLVMAAPAGRAHRQAYLETFRLLRDRRIAEQL